VSGARKFEFILKVNETKNLISIVITVIGGKNNIKLIYHNSNFQPKQKYVMS